MGLITRGEQTKAECRPIILPIYQAAIDSKEASFSLLLKIRRDLKKAECEQPESDLVKSLSWYYQQAHHFFTEKYGSIVEMHISADNNSAIALTSRRHFFSNYCLNDDSDIDRMLLRCDRMAVEAARFLDGNDLQSCTQVLYASAKTLLCIKEEGAPTSIRSRITKSGVKDASLQCLKVVKKHLNYAHEYHERAAQLNAERRYSWGMLVGSVLFTVAALSLASWINAIAGPVPEEINVLFLFASLICGGIGAAVSVMWRLINGNLTVRYDVGKWTIFTVGAFRPITGALFGLLIYALLQSGLLSFIQETDAPLFFYSVIGFLAGFSERFAPDMLQLTESRLQNETISPPSDTIPSEINLTSTKDEKRAWENGRVKRKTKDVK